MFPLIHGIPYTKFSLPLLGNVDLHVMKKIPGITVTNMTINVQAPLPSLLAET